MKDQPRYPKRLIEVDLPIRRISAHARREKSIRHGHISTLHIWWARRPLAACRAVICASLWPDPADPLCPDEFRKKARELMQTWAMTNLGRVSTDSYDRFNSIARDPQRLANDEELRGALFDFIADFADWDNSVVHEYLETSNALTMSAHNAFGGVSGTRPLVVDTFAGGGSIPLESLRVGADSFASDLNPVAALMNHVILEQFPQYGDRLIEAVRYWGSWANNQASLQLETFYPKLRDGSSPIAYLWSRTIRCEGPRCGTDVPLLRSLWLAKKGRRSVALVLTAAGAGDRVTIRIKDGIDSSKVGSGTVVRGSATCPACGYTTNVNQVRAQLKARSGGASDAVLYCVVVRTPAGVTEYREPTRDDLSTVESAVAELQRVDLDSGIVGGDSLPPDGALGFRVQKYGIGQWRHAFTPRQLLMLTTYASLISRITIPEDPAFAVAVRALLGLTISKMANFSSSLCAWRSARSCVRNTFGSQTLSMVWDFGEMNPFAGSAGDFSEGMAYLDKLLTHVGATTRRAGVVTQADAENVPLPDDAAALFFTDPPYYDAIPYSHLSRYFATWLDAVQVLPRALEVDFTISEECIVDAGLGKTASFFEKKMEACLREGRRLASTQSLGVVVFAHKSTAGWEAQLQAMLTAGWVVTASWPIDTERSGRLRAIESAALASSVHLVCRPREGHDAQGDVGDWREVLAELPRRIHEWMPRLAKEGIVGADAIFACIGPALEVFSRYSRVEKASGETVALREYLEQVWAAVAREALSMVLESADTSGLEPDGRLTAIWLWTLAGGTSSSEEPAEDEETSEDEVTAATTKPSSGFVLEYDAARKIAQGLGARLEELTHMVEVKGDKARLLPVAERTRYLFGKDSAPVKAAKKAKKKQLGLFAEIEEAAAEQGWGDLGSPQAGKTTLDRIHQAMLLFAAGRSEALKRFLVEEGAGSQPQFWKLAQSLLSLYPAGSDERRWVDGVLGRKKSFGFA